MILQPFTITTSGLICLRIWIHSCELTLLTSINFSSGIFSSLSCNSRMTSFFLCLEKVRMMGKSNKPKAICPLTLNQPSLCARFFMIFFIGMACSRMTFMISISSESPLYISLEETAWPLSITILMSILSFVSFNCFFHIYTLHSVFLIHFTVVVQNFGEHSKIDFTVEANVMRMKPKMENLSFSGSVFHLFFYSSDFQKIKCAFRFFVGS